MVCWKQAQADLTDFVMDRERENDKTLASYGSQWMLTKCNQTRIVMVLKKDLKKYGSSHDQTFDR